MMKINGLEAGGSFKLLYAKEIWDLLSLDNLELDHIGEEVVWSEKDFQEEQASGDFCVPVDWMVSPLPSYSIFENRPGRRFMSEFHHRCKCLSLLGLLCSYFKGSR